MGTVEVLAFPFGFKEINPPSIVVSLPRKAEEVTLNLLDKLHQIADNIGGARVIAQQCAEVSEILHAFERDELPKLTFASALDEISEMKREASFFSYFGVLFPVTENTLSDVEQRIKKILRELEETNCI